MQAHRENDNSITAVVLAGGAGRRMGGEDKGLLMLNGRPLIQHVLERLEPQCDSILINCNRNRTAYAEFGHPLIEDKLQGGLGPLAGLLSAMEASQSDYVISVPCDTPRLPQDLVARMLTSLQQNAAEVCTVDDGERLHPVILLVKRSLADNLRHYLESGGRKVHDWFYSTEHCTADFSDRPDAFININTPEQLLSQDQG